MSLQTRRSRLSQRFLPNFSIDVNCASEQFCKSESDTAALKERVEREKSILRKFYHILGGRNWRHDENWNSNHSLCCWKGVISSGKGFVIGIYLPGNNLSGSVEKLKFLWDLEDLQFLNLETNFGIHGLLSVFLPKKQLPLIVFKMTSTLLTGPIPWSTLGLYTNISHLQLNNCKLKGNGMGHEVGKMKCLQVLNIAMNELGGFLHPDIHQLHNLFAMDLTLLSFEGHISQLFPLRNIKYLLLEKNKFKGQLPEDMHLIWPNLEVLDLSKNRLTGNISSKMKFPINTTIIDLSQNYLVGEFPSSVLNATNLISLDVSHNRFRSISSYSWYSFLPKIQILDFSFNPFTDLTTHRLGQLFLGPFRSRKQKCPILTFNFASTGLQGDLFHLLWSSLDYLVALRLSNNKLVGKIPRPEFQQSYLQVLDLSWNDLEGSIPESCELFRSIKLIDLRGNKKLQSKSRENPMPRFTTINYDVATEGNKANFQCPQIQIHQTNGGSDYGLLYVNSTYYYHVLCRCNREHFGFYGNCRPCNFNHSKCPGKTNNSVIYMEKNTYPVPSPDNMTDLILCDSVYKDSFRCNPTNNCTCYLNDDRVTVSCTKSCLCTSHAYGRLCSQCEPHYYREDQKCHSCKKTKFQGIAVGLAIVGIFLVLFLTWASEKLQKYGYYFICGRKVARLVNTICYIALSLAIILFGTFHVLPAWLVEIYCTFVLLAVFGRLRAIKAFAMTLIMYVQVMDSLNVTSLHVECKYCSFAKVLDRMKVFEAARWVKNLINFNFYGLSCTFSPLFSPLGRLLFLVAVPFVVSGFELFLFLLDYQADCFAIRKRPLAYRLNRKKKLFELVKRKAKGQLLLLLNVFFYPISNQLIQILLPCVINPGTNDYYMKAYPWINCSSAEYRILLILGIILTVANIGLFPTSIFFLLRKRLQLSSNRRRRPCLSYLDVLISSYKKPYQKYMAIFLMLRRLALAIVISIFPLFQRDVQAILFNLLLVGFSYFVATAKPFISYTKWNFESWIDVAASFTIAVTFNCMTNRDSVLTSEVSEILVFAINFLFVLFVVAVTIIHFLVSRRAKIQQRRSRNQYIKL